jgi:broad specificity phosphatase PhoE
MRILVLRHGDRFLDGPDPQLTDLGFKQALQLSCYLRSFDIHMIFSSPMIRSLQTIAPTALILQKPIHVDECLCDILADGWLYPQDPIPHLYWNKNRKDLPHVPDNLLSTQYTSPRPSYPDLIGKLEKGNDQQRHRIIQRHRDAAQRILQFASQNLESIETRTIVIVAHGGTSDFLAEIFDPHSHILDHHVPFCVPHVSVTSFVLPKIR